MNNKNEQPDVWRPELLAGYADGELGPADRLAVDAWLAQHPERAKELAGQECFARKNVAFWQQASVTSPSETTWSDALVQIREHTQCAIPSTIEYRVFDGEPHVAPTLKSRSRLALGVAGTAIALLFAINFFPNTRNGFDPDSGLDAYPVARTGDVEILSLQGDDSGIIVVGNPPLIGTLDLVTVGDIGLEAIDGESDLRNARPEHRAGDPKRPMLIVPNDRMHPVP